MGQNVIQVTATGTYTDTSEVDISLQAAWAVSDSSIITVGAGTGIVTMTNAGKIWGADVGVTATLSPGTPGTASMLVIASDSGSVAPRMPQQNNHWVALGLSPWGAFGGCQEATGTLVLSGSAGYSLTPVNAAASLPALYAQPVAGWTRVGVAPGSGSSSGRFAAAAGVGPNPATTSMALLCYALVGPSAVGSQFFGLGAAAGGERLILVPDSTNASTGQVDMSYNGVLRRLTGPLTSVHTDRVHPYLIVYNRTTAEVWSFTDQVLAVSSSAPAQVDGTKMFGANNNSAASGTMVYWASCTGSVAESYASVSGGANLLNALGWSVAYRNCPPDSGTIRCPFTPACWQSLGLTPWAATHNFQEVTGNCVSFSDWTGTSINGWTLTSNLNITYMNAQAGWARRSVDIAEVASARLATGNNLIGSYTGSVAFMGYARINTAAGASRSLLGGWGTLLGSQFRVQYGTAGVPQLNCSGTATTGLNDHRDGRVHPFLAVYDVANSRAKLYTDIEAITGSFGVLNVAPNLGIGAIVAGQTAAPASHLYFSIATGSVAELLSDDGRASAFLKTLGWSLPW